MLGRHQEIFLFCSLLWPIRYSQEDLKKYGQEEHSFGSLAPGCDVVFLINAILGVCLVFVLIVLIRFCHFMSLLWDIIEECHLLSRKGESS